jgi:Arc/MetJ-type ribon-helix-helix transcriptional regulator
MTPAELEATEVGSLSEAGRAALSAWQNKLQKGEAKKTRANRAALRMLKRKLLELP